jgi:hypothetical protein
MKNALISSFVVYSFLALAGDRIPALPIVENAPPTGFEFPLPSIELGQTNAKYTAKSISDLIADLGSPTYSDRALASRELLRRGEDSVPALLEVKDSPDTEVRSRATNALALLTAPIVIDIQAYSEQFIQFAQKVAQSQRWAAHCTNVQTRIKGQDGRARSFREVAEETTTMFSGVIALRQTLATLTRQRAELESRKAAVQGKDAVKEINILSQIDSSQKLYQKMSESLRAAEESFVTKSQDLLMQLAHVDGGAITDDFAFHIQRKKLIGVATDEAMRIEIPLRAGLPLEAQRAAKFRNVPVLLSDSKATPEAQSDFKVWFRPSLEIDLTSLACTSALDWGGAIDEKNPDQEYPELDAIRSAFRKMHSN